MGWPWPFSSPGPAGSAPSQTASSNAPPEENTSRNVQLSEEQRLRIFGTPNPISNSAPTTPSAAPASTTDAEVESFLKSFESPSPSTTITTTSTSTDPTTPSPAPSPPTRIRPDGSIDISPEALLPRTMSCRQAFDQAFYCQSLGGKFNDVYRYGTIQSCSEQWGAFWFCMRIRTFPEAQRQGLIADYYREREETRRAARNGASSEDVWRVRETALTSAFDRDPEAEGNTELEKEVMRSRR